MKMVKERLWLVMEVSIPSAKTTHHPKVRNQTLVSKARLEYFTTNETFILLIDEELAANRKCCSLEDDHSNGSNTEHTISEDHILQEDSTAFEHHLLDTDHLYGDEEIRPSKLSTYNEASRKCCSLEDDHSNGPKYEHSISEAYIVQKDSTTSPPDPPFTALDDEETQGSSCCQLGRQDQQKSVRNLLRIMDEATAQAEIQNNAGAQGESLTGGCCELGDEEAQHRQAVTCCCHFEDAGSETYTPEAIEERRLNCVLFYHDNTSPATEAGSAIGSIVAAFVSYSSLEESHAFQQGTSFLVSLFFSRISRQL
jgi:hypothetical protein